MITAPNFYCYFEHFPAELCAFCLVCVWSPLIIAKVSVECIAGVDLNCQHLGVHVSLLHPLHSVGSTGGDQQQVAHKQMSMMQL